MEMEVRLFLQQLAKHWSTDPDDKPRGLEDVYDETPDDAWDIGFRSAEWYLGKQAQKLLDKYAQPVVEENSINLRGMTYG